MLTILLSALAVVFFGLATFGTSEHPRFHFVPAGLFCLALIYLLGAIPAH